MSVPPKNAAAFPSPLAGEGGSTRSGETDEGFSGEKTNPSSGPSGHLLPQGKKGEAPRLVGFAKAMRKAPTEAERALWHILRGRRFSGFKFRRQVPIGPFIADFICFNSRLIVEADGSQHAENDHDLARDAWFVEQGFRVRRFWNADILNRREMIGDTIWADLADMANPSFGPSGHLLPQGEKGGANG